MNWSRFTRIMLQREFRSLAGQIWTVAQQQTPRRQEIDGGNKVRSMTVQLSNGHQRHRPINFLYPLKKAHDAEYDVESMAESNGRRIQDKADKKLEDISNKEQGQLRSVRIAEKIRKPSRIINQ